MRLTRFSIMSVFSFLVPVFLLSSCGSKSPTSAAHDHGYVSLSVIYDDQEPSSAKLAEIDEVDAYVYGPDNALIGSASLDRVGDTAYGVLEVPVGAGRWLDLVALEQSTVIWLGRAENIAVVEAETTQVTVTMRRFVPWMRNIDNAGRSGDYTVSWTPVAHAGSYTVQESIDQSFSSSTSTDSNSDTSLAITDQPEGTYWYRVRATSGYGHGLWSNAKAATVTSAGTGHGRIQIEIPWPQSGAGFPDPLAHWSFDDPLHIGIDETGNGNHLTIPGTYESVGRKGTDDAVRFHAHDTGGDAPYGPHIATSGLAYPGAHGFTVAFWVKMEDGVVADGVHDYWGSAGGGESSFRLWASGVNKQAQFLVQSDHGRANDPHIATDISSHVGQWIHLVGVYVESNSGILLYINGIRRGTGNIVPPMAPNRPPYLYISGNWVETFEQSIDDVMIWDRPLTDGEVAAVAGL